MPTDIESYKIKYNGGVGKYKTPAKQKSPAKDTKRVADLQMHHEKTMDHDENNEHVFNSPTTYAPFKMKAANHGNSPMLKNFPNDISAPTKFGSIAARAAGMAGMMGGGGSGSGWGGFGGLAGGMDRIREMMAKRKQKKATGGMISNLMGGGGGMRGRVRPHGDEAHTSGGGAIGAEEPIVAQEAVNDPRRAAALATGGGVGMPEWQSVSGV